MLRLPNLSLPLSYADGDLLALVCRKLKLTAALVQSITLVKKSIDARDKGDVHFVLTVDVSVKNEDDVLR
ncbi:MAG: hypothetical protein IJW85_10875, partial [Clostridia bacterium]|nr:hypothetical protein [Clostridia bacterium]